MWHCQLTFRVSKSKLIFFPPKPVLSTDSSISVSGKLHPSIAQCLPQPKKKKKKLNEIILESSQFVFKFLFYLQNIAWIQPLPPNLNVTSCSKPPLNRRNWLHSCPAQFSPRPNLILNPATKMESVKLQCFYVQSPPKVFLLTITVKTDVALICGLPAILLWQILSLTQCSAATLTSLPFPDYIMDVLA